MNENHLIPAALKSSGQVRENPVVSANYNKLSDNIRRLAPHGLQCTMFCGGAQCKYENPNNWTSTGNAIQGIFSNWITDDILAMARPSTSILIKKNVIQQFHSWGIKSIINLQTPKEHASCGPPLEESGFTYDPAIFMENNIFYYNFTWKDYGDASLEGLLDMVKVLAFAVKEGRVAIHCHAGLGRTGVLIACYLVYILRVRANDAINYIRLKRPGSVQTRGQILCIQEFAQYILPLSLVYNIKEVASYQQKEKKAPDLTLSKFIKYQRVVLHGYEERSLKNVPKIVYRICQRILLLSNCWCNEFAIGNVSFTNNFLTTKLNFKNRDNSSRNVKLAESGSQHTLSNSSTVRSNVTSPEGESARSEEILPVRWKENGGSAVSGKASSSSASSNCMDLLDNINEDITNDNLRENKCYQLLSQLQCGSAHEIAEPYSIEEVAEALLVDHQSLDDVTKKSIRQYEIDFNCNQTTWSKLKSERNLVVLTGLMYDWIETLKTPVINREDLSNIVIYNSRPEICLQKLNIDSQYLVEFIVRFLTHLQPCSNATTLTLLRRFAGSFTQKTVLIQNVRLPTGRGFQKLREGTLEYLLNFLYSLYKKFEANKRLSGVSSKLYMSSGSTDILSGNEETDDDSDVECPETQ